MRYLNIEETIAVDEENKKILFLNPEEEGKSFTIRDNQRWKLFLLLLSREGKEYKTTELALKIVGNANADIKGLINKLKNELNEKGIPCNCKKDEKDPTKITILNKPNSGILENNGSYTLLLPKIEKKTEKVLTDLFWNRYESLSAQKEGEHKNDEIIAKIGDVYQLPLIQESGNDCKWNINNLDLYDQNILIEAPNGYGKTTFMRSILLAASYKYRMSLSQDDIRKYENIRLFHSVDESYLCIYLECKNFDFKMSEDGVGVEWIYDVLAEIESIRIDRYITREAFNELLRDYNMSKKLILLVDGFDEISLDNRVKLIKRLNAFQHDIEFGANSRIVMSTRPLFWGIDFNGYKKYSISNRNIVEDKTVFMQYAKSYTSNSKSLDAEYLYDYVVNNYYLRKIACTPAVIVWIVREFQGKSAFYESIERIIEQIMLRFKSRELTVYKEQYKRVYEELAFKYLCLSEEDDGLAYLQTEMLSLVRVCIERIESEGNKRFNKIFAGNKDDEDLGELFFTNVALMEFINGRVKFSNIVFAYHLAARRLLRFFKEDGNSDVRVQLDLLPYQSRYYVMVIATSLVLHLTDVRFFEDYGSNADDIRFNLSEIFIEYIRARWNDSSCTENEKSYIQEATAHILLKYYGENVYTNRNLDNKDYVSWMDGILKVQLKECHSAVSRYLGEKR